MLKALVKVNQSLSDFLFTSHRAVNLPMSIKVRANRGEAIRNLETGEFVNREASPVLRTKTEAVSRNSVSFVVPSIRFCDANLAGEGRVLDIEIELPEGKVRFEAIGESYERFGKRTSLAQYVIRARISYINPLEGDVFRAYLRNRATVVAEPESLVFRINER